VAPVTLRSLPRIVERDLHRRAPVLNYAARRPVRLLLAPVQLEPSASSVDPLSSVDDAPSPSVAPFTAATLAACCTALSVEPRCAAIGSTADGM